MNRKEHWETVYRRKPATDVSWYQPNPERSLRMIERALPEAGTRIIDVGGGASILVDRLLQRDGLEVSVLDLSGAALAQAQARLGVLAVRVDWIEADITLFRPDRQWDVWHDRAVFHFLTEPDDRAAYRSVLNRALSPGGQVVIATFGPQGPTRCSGLDVVRYSPEALHAALGAHLERLETTTERHVTPAGAVQEFIYCRFRVSDAKERGVPRP